MGCPYTTILPLRLWRARTRKFRPVVYGRAPLGLRATEHGSGYAMQAPREILCLVWLLLVMSIVNSWLSRISALSRLEGGLAPTQIGIAVIWSVHIASGLSLGGAVVPFLNLGSRWRWLAGQVLAEAWTLAGTEANWASGNLSTMSTGSLASLPK